MRRFHGQPHKCGLEIHLLVLDGLNSEALRNEPTGYLTHRETVLEIQRDVDSGTAIGVDYFDGFDSPNLGEQLRGLLSSIVECDVDDFSGSGLPHDLGDRAVEQQLSLLDDGDRVAKF